MRRTFMTFGTAVMLAAVMAGCSASGASTDCKAQGTDVTVCLDKKPIDFSAAKNKPHLHDNPATVYAPAKVLASAVGVQYEEQVASDGKSAKVTVNGKAFEPTMPSGAKGVHVHDGEAFVPVQKFAEAAGLKADVKADQGTAGIAK